MIFGSIEQDQLVRLLDQIPVLQFALQWIKQMPAKPEPGITEFQGKDLYVNVHGYATQTRPDCRWESHRHTADVQFGIEGSELIDWTPASHSGPSEGYEPSKDFEFWPHDILPVNTLRLARGMFAIFTPGELHRPMIVDGHSPNIVKGVFKINARLLHLRNPNELAI